MDLERIEALLKLLSEHDVREFNYRDDEKSIRLKLGVLAAPATAAYAAPPPLAAAPPPHAAGPAAAAPAPAGNLKTIESPMVGTFYRSATPDGSSFCEVGDVVQKGKPLCIVEAMKLMNEIECEVTGTVVEILVENGHAVQFGQALFKIRPS